MAGLYGGGLMEATLSGQQMKCVMVGNAAASGVMAATFAEYGMDGTLTVFEGKTGLFFAMSQDVDTEKVCADIGKRYSIADTYVKFYPTSRHAQAGIEAVLELQRKYGFIGEEIEMIHVGTYEVSVRLAGGNHRPQNQGQAKFSIPYGIAVGLTTGGISPLFLTEPYLRDENLLGLAAKVTVEKDEKIQSKYPEKRGAHVSVLLRDGKLYENELVLL